MPAPPSLVSRADRPRATASVGGDLLDRPATGGRTRSDLTRRPGRGDHRIRTRPRRSSRSVRFRRWTSRSGAPAPAAAADARPTGPAAGSSPAIITSVGALVRLVGLGGRTDGGTPLFDEKYYAIQA